MAVSTAPKGPPCFSTCKLTLDSQYGWWRTHLWLLVFTAQPRLHLLLVSQQDRHAVVQPSKAWGAVCCQDCVRGHGALTTTCKAWKLLVLEQGLFWNKVLFMFMLSGYRDSYILRGSCRSDSGVVLLPKVLDFLVSVSAFVLIAGVAAHTLHDTAHAGGMWCVVIVKSEGHPGGATPRHAHAAHPPP
jgi:hypothetical protein